MTGELEYECPKCGEGLPAEARFCPGCGLEFGKDGGWEETQEEGPATSGDTAGGEAPTDVEATLEELTEVVAKGEAEEEAPPKEEAPVEEPSAPPPTKAPRKGFLGGLVGSVGLTFLILAVLAVVGTVALLNWDVWIQGASEESIGDRQRLFVYLGVVGVVVCAAVTAVDVLRRRK